ncbi:MULTISPECIES: hypothetical protein [unclassified Marinobacter]|uniref:hypothetical protein n=1 Tax=unclassified Marinobacter TaxID=83889 RepID=UPI00200C9337|nr:MULTISPECIES: hypothetical protein [unclassified Marinobacter]UQG55520.1 hypothetical protein MIH16_19355 [Marinobacter sp. M4C]UQG64324.1 hypothetical protein MIH17_19350 [Marinobacter sp. M2C]UQG68603.1 hypothetical protein MIH19_19360 [Marinobacter sp. M1C]
MKITRDDIKQKLVHLHTLAYRAGLYGLLQTKSFYSVDGDLFRCTVYHWDQVNSAPICDFIISLDFYDEFGLDALSNESALFRLDSLSAYISGVIEVGQPVLGSVNLDQLEAA